MATPENNLSQSEFDWERLGQEVFGDRDETNEFQLTFAGLYAEIEHRAKIEELEEFSTVLTVLRAAGISEFVDKEIYYRLPLDNTLSALVSPVTIVDGAKTHNLLRITFNEPTFNEEAKEPMLHIRDYFIDFDKHLIFGSEDDIPGQPKPGSAFSDSTWFPTQESPPVLDYNFATHTLEVQHGKLHEQQIRERILSGVNEHGARYFIGDMHHFRESDKEPVRQLVNH